MLTRENKVLKTAQKTVLVSSVMGLSIIWGMALYFWMIFPLQETEYIANSGTPTFTQAVCAKMQYNKLSQSECYAKVAKTRRDEKVCDKISVSEVRLLCLVELAEIKHDSKICKREVLTPSLAALCSEYFNETNAEAAAGTDVDLASWQAYDNALLGFSMKFPDSWEMAGRAMTGVKLIPPANRLQTQPAEDSGDVAVVVEANPNRQDLQAWLTESKIYLSQAEADRMKKTSDIGVGYLQKEITIGGKSALDQYLDGPGGSERHVFVPQDDKIIVISLKSDWHFSGKDGATDSVQNLVDTFDKFLLTFSFTKK